MAYSFSIPPAGSAPPLTIGERSETPIVGSTALTETVVDVPVAPPSIFGDANDPKEGFVFPLVDL